MTEQLYTYRFPIKPTADQRLHFAKTFGCCRFVYNHFLRRRLDTYEKEGRYISFSEMSAELTQLKKEFVWLKEVNSQSLQRVLKDLQRAYDGYFKKRGGHPKFKKRGYRNTFVVPAYTKVDQGNGRIKIPKLKSWINTHFYRTVEGDIRYVAIVKERTSRYYVTVVVKREIQHLPKTGKAVGVDLGIKNFAVLSNGTKLPKLNPYRHAEKRLGLLHRRLDRKQKGSRRRERARTKLARCYRRVTLQRHDFLHKLSKDLVSQYDLIAIEDLHPQGMKRNRKLSKSISDCGWGTFARQLEYKANWYGKKLVKIDRWFPSTKTCSDCDHVVKALPLKIREWNCPGCGVTHDRDVNAAINILTAGSAGSYARGDRTAVRRRKATSKSNRRSENRSYA
jgi:putative transposase